MRPAVSSQPPETFRVPHRRVVCDGAGDVSTGSALGHPRVWLEIDESGFVECGYCDRRFVLAGGPADNGGPFADQPVRRASS
jgi:NADH dehydrogenase (ubiquinone) Fe-S protein 6